MAEEKHNMTEEEINQKINAIFEDTVKDAVDEIQTKLIVRTEIRTTAKLLFAFKDALNLSDDKLLEIAQIPEFEDWHYKPLFEELAQEKEIAQKVEQDEKATKAIEDLIEKETENVSPFHQFRVVEEGKKQLIEAVSHAAYKKAEDQVKKQTPKYVKSVMENLNLSSDEAVKALNVSEHYKPELADKEMVTLNMAIDPDYHRDLIDAVDKLNTPVLQKSDKLITDLASEQYDQTIAEYIRTLMSSSHLSVDEAINAIGIQEDSKQKYRSLVTEKSSD